MEKQQQQYFILAITFHDGSIAMIRIRGADSVDARRRAVHVCTQNGLTAKTIRLIETETE